MFVKPFVTALGSFTKLHLLSIVSSVRPTGGLYFARSKSTVNVSRCLQSLNVLQNLLPLVAALHGHWSNLQKIDVPK